jgi:transcriptional regulator with XRE-family HTH domain
MITNAREYQITRAQLARLTDALTSGGSQQPPEGVHPTIYQAELASLASELERLRSDINAYEDLLSGRKIRFDAQTLSELPQVLIQARIASRWSQKDLAERLGLHEQQVQRYEATRYRGVSFDRILEIAASLGVHVEQTALLAAPVVSKARTHLRKIGFSDDFLSSRILPQSQVEDDEDVSSAAPALDRICHVFGWKPEQLVAGKVPRVSPAAMGGALFKLPAGRNPVFLEAYTAYAYRLAQGAVRCAQKIPTRPLPANAQEARRLLLASGPITLSSVVDWLWSHGVILIPLSDKAAFHAAFWRIDGRNVVVLKQRTDSVDRLVHDALHEAFHASQQPELSARVVLEGPDPLKSRESEEEDAVTFASDVLLDGRANELALSVAKEAGGYGPALKAAVQRVASDQQLSVGALANHLAWVLDRQDTPINWWGTANSLQASARADLSYAVDVAFARLVPPAGKDDADVELLFRALRTELRT